MNKTIIAAGIALSLSLMSCGGIKKAALTDIDGEWNITEIDGARLKPTGSRAPFIGFDTKEGRIYGYSGCNRIMSAIDKKTGKMSFGNMASTMMACPDMETESKVQGALVKVKSFRKAGESKVELCDDTGSPVVTLEKRFYAMELSELDGEWHIKTVYGQPVTTSTGKHPALSFDTRNGRLGGNAGCNRIMGRIIHDKADSQSLSFGQTATTRMACPDMDTENNVLTALRNVKSFGKLQNGNVALYAEGGTQVLELSKEMPDRKYTIEGTWLEPRPGMDGKQGFTLKNDGTATSENMSTLKYEKWETADGKLILKGKSIGNHTVADFSDTLSIISAGNNTLTLKDGKNTRTFERKTMNSIPAYRLTPAKKIKSVKGKLVMGHETSSFTPEGYSETYWITDKTGNLIRKYNELTNGKRSGDCVYAELEVTESEKTADGLATGYAGVLEVTNIIRLTDEK